jgi:hypothetical protein
MVGSQFYFHYFSTNFCQSYSAASLPPLSREHGFLCLAVMFLTKNGAENDVVRVPPQAEWNNWSSPLNQV